MKILIADDSDLLRLSIRKLLQPIEDIQQVYEAETPQAAIAMIAGYYPDVVILDLRFASGTGFDVMDYLIEHDLDMLVIVLTNFATSHNKQKSYDMGAHFFFDKSHEYEKLEQVIRDFHPRS